MGKEGAALNGFLQQNRKSIGNITRIFKSSSVRSLGLNEVDTYVLKLYHHNQRWDTRLFLPSQSNKISTSTDLHMHLCCCALNFSPDTWPTYDDWWAGQGGFLNLAVTSQAHIPVNSNCWILIPKVWAISLSINSLLSTFKIRTIVVDKTASPVSWKLPDLSRPGSQSHLEIPASPPTPVEIIHFRSCTLPDRDSLARSAVSICPTRRIVHQPRNL